MMFLPRLLLALAALMGMLSAAAAHPHVWVSVKSRVVYGKGGVPEAIRHVWTFDEPFSAFAIQGLDTNNDGQYSREELAPLAQTNVESLGEYGFFTFGKEGKHDLDFNPPQDYWLEYDGKALTLHFTLPMRDRFASPEAAYSLEVYDPTYFVSFTWADQNAVTLEGAPGACRALLRAPPKDASAQAATGQPLSEDFFNSLDANSTFGEQFANTVFVACTAPDIAKAQDNLTKPPISADAEEEQGEEEAAAVAAAEAPAPPKDEASVMRPAAALAAPSSSPSLGAFGLIRPDGALASTSGVFGWIAAKQAAFYQKMSATLSQAKTDGSAFGLLVLLGFLYGMLHAAGPGHGKAVISSYLIATGETFRRGALMSFVSAMLQALVAVIVVGVFALILGAANRAMGIAAYWLEALSYAAIAVLGASIIWRTWRRRARKHHHDHSHDHGHHHHEHGHTCGAHCNHSHAPEPAQLEGRFDLRQAMAAIVAVGVRPCTGAIIVLVFALTQGLFWAGVAATFAMALGTAITVTAIAALAVWAKQVAVRLAGRSSASGGMVLTAIEVLAGLVVMGFGLLLLIGMLVSGIPS